MNCKLRPSNNVKGTLWLVAALPFVLGPAVFGSSNAAAGIGFVFILLGIMSFRKR